MIPNKRSVPVKHQLQCSKTWREHINLRLLTKWIYLELCNWHWGIVTPLLHVIYLPIVRPIVIFTCTSWQKLLILKVSFLVLVLLAISSFTWFSNFVAKVDWGSNKTRSKQLDSSALLKNESKHTVTLSSRWCFSNMRKVVSVTCTNISLVSSRKCSNRAWPAHLA